MRKFGKGCLIIIGVCVVLGIIGAVLGGGRTTQNATSAQPTTAAISGIAQPAGAGAPTQSAPAAAPAAPGPTDGPTIFAVGQDVQLAEVRWTIRAAEDLGQTLKSDNQFIKDKTTSGHFVRVQFDIENLSKDMLTFAGLDLVDDQGRTFKGSSDAFGFIEEEQHCVFENLNPNVAKTCTAIYEVPTNAAGLKAQVSDLKILGNQTALIDLDLGSK